MIGLTKKIFCSLNFPRQPAAKRGLPGKIQSALILTMCPLTVQAQDYYLPSGWIIGYFVLGVVCGLVVIAGFRS